MKNPLLFFPLILSLMTSCGSSKFKDQMDSALSKRLDSTSAAEEAARNAPPVNISFDQLSDKNYDGKKVIVEGYVAAPTSSYVSSTSAQIDFYGRKDQFYAANNVIVSVPVGTGKNTMYSLPDKYTPEDIKITADDKSEIHAGDHVRITGKLSANGMYSSIDLDKVEKIADTDVDYSTLNAMKLTKATWKDSTMDGKLVYAEGTLEIPMMTMDGNYTWFYLHSKDVSNDLTVNISYGNGANKVEPLSDNYRKSDVKIRDHKGDVVGNHKVRVYGVLHSESIYVENIVQL
ncbi:MAG TPA: hypothetical protein VFU15_01155 [Bacteroidia bacterium]|nr:hypothetical protein [Bacteroidia bacterium]